VVPSFSGYKKMCMRKMVRTKGKRDRRLGLSDPRVGLQIKTAL
jgi:hypothetical protein